MATPQTAEEARKQGYELKTLSADEARRLMESGSPGLEATRRDCTEMSHGQLCWEGNCVQGLKEVLYCDGSFCTTYGKIRC
jgi:hypothetical protein